MPYPGLLHPEPLSLQQSTADPDLLRRHLNTVLSQSLWDLWVLVCTRYFWALWASLVGMGFDSKCNFTPPPILLGLLLCPWMLGIFYGGIQHSPVGGCSAVSCSFGVLSGEDECTSFYPAILHWTHIYHPATFGGTPSPSTSLMKQCWTMWYESPQVLLKASFSRFSSTCVTLHSASL